MRINLRRALKCFVLLTMKAEFAEEKVKPALDGAVQTRDERRITSGWRHTGVIERVLSFDRSSR